ncbi:MAG: AAA family ATPase, partial [Pseudomonadota bacterium]
GYQHNGKLKSFWNQPNLQAGLWRGFMRSITANDRLSICDQQPSIPPNSQKSKPQHVLYEDDTALARASGYFKRAFGKDILINYRGGSVIPVHVGERPPAHLVDRASSEYVDALSKNPLLERQGDGMKSFAGIIFQSIVVKHHITLIDEPEAFLHPPQMRKLGNILAAAMEGQLFIATHSSDILRGCLEATKGNVRILRITRDGDRNFVTEASEEAVAELWTRPELRYSNAFDSIFHEQVLICEDDSDCRLYNAVANHMEDQGSVLPPDSLYLPVGGRQGAKLVAPTLLQLGIPTKCILDIDFLSDRQLVRDTYEAFGGSWSDIETIWSRLNAEVSGKVVPRTREEIASEVSRLILQDAEKGIPRSAIMDAIRRDSPWGIVKSVGPAAIPRGQGSTLYQELVGALAARGIYIVPVGIPENFVPSIGAKGPTFVDRFLREADLSDPSLAQFRSFVGAVLLGQHGGSTDTLR